MDYCFCRQKIKNADAFFLASAFLSYIFNVVICASRLR
ncbi:putative membrane protein [Alteromonas macleodii]|nr:putative membrane protein [Alteromonas macleodii]